MTGLRKELSNLTFEELLALKEKLGTKEYDEAIFGSQKKKSETPGSSEPGSSNTKRTEFKRKTKNRPREMSSKVRVPPVPPKVRQIPPSQRKRDPRFENDCGKVNEKV